MINSQTLSNPVFLTFLEEEIKLENKKGHVNPPLFEKMVNAFILVESLQQEGLNFTFKGGTSLVLLLSGVLKRFSIDIDIITLQNREEIENVLNKICQKKTFQNWTLDEARSYKTGIPKAHYELEFVPKSNLKNDNKILLDVLFEENMYSRTSKISINKKWLEFQEPIIKIECPTIESIAGDKLTAFAPTTIGIEYGKGKGVEIIKQLFDLGNLFDEIDDFETTKKTYLQIANSEIKYRSLTCTYLETLQDTFDACLTLIKRENNELNNAIISFSNWTTVRFTINEAIEAAGKVAYLSAKIMKNNTTQLEKFDSSKMSLINFRIENENAKYNFINKKVKNTGNNALFYWKKAIELISN